MVLDAAVQIRFRNRLNVSDTNLEPEWVATEQFGFAAQTLGAFHETYRRLFLLASITLSASQVLAQSNVTSTSILKQGDPLEIPGEFGGGTFEAGRVRSLTAGGPNAFAAVLNTELKGRSVIWGGVQSPQQSHGLVLRAPMMFKEEINGDSVRERQAMFEQTCGISRDGLVVYSTMVLDNVDPIVLNAGGARLVDTLWFDGDDQPNSLLKREGGELAGDFEGRFWRSVSLPGVTSGGTPYWMGSTATTATGDPTDVAVWKGLGSKPDRVLGTGDRITDYGLRVSGAGLSHFSMSPDGTKLFAIANLTGFPGSRAQSIVSVAMSKPQFTKGIHLETGDLISTADPNHPGWEPWKEFTHIASSNVTGCTPQGAWFVIGEISQNPTSRFVLTRENVVLLREGSEVREHGQPTTGVTPKYTLMGRPMALTANSFGDWATIWYARLTSDAPTTVPTGVVIVNGEVVLAHDDVVTEGAGSFTIHDLRPHLAIGERKNSGDIDVYAVARQVESTGAKNEHIVRIGMFAGPLNCCVADLTSATSPGVRDGAVDINDLLFFLTHFEAGDAHADVSGIIPGQPDGGVGIDDLLYYLNRFEAGC